MCPRRADPPALPQIPRMSWPTFYEWLRVRPDQSISIVGSMGSGKSTLIAALLPKYDRWCLLATKQRDRVLSAITSREGVRKIDAWPKPNVLNKHPDPGPCVVVWPNAPDLRTARARQKIALREAMERVYSDGVQAGGGRVLVIDESRVVTVALGLRALYSELLTQGRSVDVPVIAGSQRCAWVPVEMWSEATHLFIFPLRDRRDLQEIRQMGGAVDPESVVAAVLSLDASRHEVLYVNRVSGRMAITTAPSVA